MGRKPELTPHQKREALKRRDINPIGDEVKFDDAKARDDAGLHELRSAPHVDYSLLT